MYLLSLIAISYLHICTLDDHQTQTCHTAMATWTQDDGLQSCDGTCTYRDDFGAGAETARAFVDLELLWVLTVEGFESL